MLRVLARAPVPVSRTIESGVSRFVIGITSCTARDVPPEAPARVA